MAKATSVFEKQAATYRGPREKLVPQMDRFYGMVPEAVRLASAAAGSGEGPLRVLDLGAGTGMLSAVVSESFPSASFTLFDFSPRMLEQARELLGEGSVVVSGDMYEGIPAGPWDAVISALAIHHMTDEGKRSVYESAFRELGPGGVFVNAEHVLGETPALQEHYARWHRWQAYEKGLTDAEWADTVERMSHDHLTPLSTQLGWLREIGFTDVDCLWKDHGFAVFFGRRS
ncbi:MAG: class I SAM-dependent methyltransferase [Solirubrobacterales bacterium]|nr:class I SAM-dependent methyltransferase [Solirubrobacterales bacterium]HRV60178.1 class I SAM-dependent methyltransferase [Solirubrobacterales bacterium]